MCHQNGSAPHLTEFGYMYRRMAFHWPGKLGDEKADEEAMNATKHISAGVNVAYIYGDNSAGDGKTNVSANGIDVPEVEIWPLVGGFLGRWGVWSEIDSAPNTNRGGAVKLGLADIRYADGTPDKFINFRVGMIAAEGFGAGDQWFSDGNVPLMDVLAAQKNQDTFVLPWGAMGAPELGAEVGLNLDQSHLTLGLYDGFTNLTANTSSTGGTFTQTTGTSTAAVAKEGDVGMRDYRIQFDQFLGQIGEITVDYYSGTTPNLDPNGNFTWLDHYSQARIYLTEFIVPGKLDLLAGLGWSKNEFVESVPTPHGTFEGQGGFFGVMWYAAQHMNFAARVDRYQFNDDGNTATGESLQASFPFENRILIFHLNHTSSNLASGPSGLLAGYNNDIGLVYRFLL
jgi:hypothetical protein